MNGITAQEKQQEAITSNVTSIFKAYMQFDVPISLFPFLFHKLEKNFKHLINQAHSRKGNLDKIVLTLFCHENRETHVIEVNLDSDLNFFENLLNVEAELLKIDLDNPICGIEMILFTLKTKKTRHQVMRDKINSLLKGSITTGQRKQRNHLSNRALKIKPMDEAEFTPLHKEELTQYSFISHRPMEDDLSLSRGRDYYLAFDTFGNKVWIYFDHLEMSYFKMDDCA